MKFSWTPKSIEWYLVAEKKSTFYKEIISLLKPYLKEIESVLDIGCGLGSVAIGLAKEGVKVTALDISTPAVSTLEERAEKMKLTNLEPLNMPFQSLSVTKKYDMVFICYVMGLLKPDKINKIINHAKKYIVVILPAEEMKNDFSIQSLIKRLGLDNCRLKQCSYKDVIPLLNQLKIHYDIKTFETEFGQPFNDLKESKEFLEHYFRIPDNKNEELGKWLAENLKRESDYYYLPNQKKSAMIIMRKGAENKHAEELYT